MAARPADYPNEPKVGFLFKTAKVFYMPLTKSKLEGLADLCEILNELEVGDALGIYVDDELILSWHDLPEDPIFVSSFVQERDLKDFCSILDSTYFYEV